MKKINVIVNGLFIRGRKLNISLAFIGQSYFPDSKKLTLNSTRYFIMKTPNRWELQEISFNHQWDRTKTLLIFNRIYTANHIFFVIDTTLPTYNPTLFRKNHLEKI